MLAFSVNPNQTVTIAIQSMDGYGIGLDGYSEPEVAYVLLPSGAFAAGYPVSMTKVLTNTYTLGITLPSTVGTYLVGVNYADIYTGAFKQELFLLNSIRPFGNSSVSPAL